MLWNIENKCMIVMKHLEINQILAWNNPSGVTRDHNYNKV